MCVGALLPSHREQGKWGGPPTMSLQHPAAAWRLVPSLPAAPGKECDNVFSRKNVDDADAKPAGVREVGI